MDIITYLLAKRYVDSNIVNNGGGDNREAPQWEELTVSNNSVEEKDKEEKDG